MNQLTVMLNGQTAAAAAASNGQHGQHQQTSATAQQPQQQHSTQQFFTFQTGPGQHGTGLHPIQTTPTGLATIGDHHPTHQLVTFQTPPQAQMTSANVMLAQTGSQFHTATNPTQPGTIQYIITPSIQQPTHQTNQTIQMATTGQTQPFGLMSNLITPGINMIPVNQALPNSSGATATISLQPQLLSNGTALQPTFINQPTGTFQIQTNSANPTQIFQQQGQQQQQQQQFQMIGATNATNATLTNGAIINSNQLISTPVNGQQFILNQTLTPATNQQQQQQPVYQLVLPNGQIIQTLQQTTATATGNLLSTPILSPQQQPTAITVPIQNPSNPINTAILASNLTFPNHQTATFLTPGPQPAQPTATIPVNSTIQLASQQQSPTITNVFTNVPTSTGAIRDNYLSLNPMQNSPNLLVANQATNISNRNQQQQQTQSMIVNSSNSITPTTSTSTTAMMVLTQTSVSSSSSSSSTPLMPTSVLDQKSVKSISKNSKTRATEHCIDSPNNNQMASLTGLVVHNKIDKKTNSNSTNNNTNTSSSTTPKLFNGFMENKAETTNGDKTPSVVNNSPRRTPKLAMVLTKNDGDSTTNNNNENNIVSSSDPSKHKQIRPSSVASSCGSLKIAENDDDDMTDSDDKNMLNAFDCVDAELNDNLSTETEMDADSASTEIDSDSKSKELNFNDIHSTTNMTVETTNTKKTSNNNNNNSDKEGYQSSYGGSPCHFTDTEDEEEEENETGENGQIKLIRRNGLTPAAFNLINNRILSSEEDNATTASIDSKCSSTSTSMVNEELCSINDMNKMNNEKTNSIDNGISKISIQIQTSAAPSPANSIQSNGSLAEVESTTQNTLISSKEKTIWNPEEQKLINEIQDFAKTFKLCRLSLGLTQSQVGQELSALGPCYSQSAICRFEKLDITLKSAKKIKPVLENWMREAEEKYKGNKIMGNVNPEALANGLPTNKDNTAVVGSGSFKISSALELVNKNNNKNNNNNNTSNKRNGSSDAISSNVNIYKVFMDSNKKRKRRTSFTPAAIDALNKFFEENNHPNGTQMTEISEFLNYDRDVVRVWFCNKRQATKAKNKNEINNTTNMSPTNDSTNTIPNQSNPNQKTKDENKPTTNSTVTNGAMVATSTIPGQNPLMANNPQLLPPLISTIQTQLTPIVTKPAAPPTAILHPGQFFNPMPPSHAQAIKTIIPVNGRTNNTTPPLATMAPTINGIAPVPVNSTSPKNSHHQDPSNQTSSSSSSS